MFPIVNITPGESKERGDLSGLRVLGSSFSLGRGLFITANHVLAEALAGGPRLGYGEGSELRSVAIDAYELVPDLDIAIFRANVPTARAVPWASNQLGALEDVAAFGYPYAVDESGSLMVARAFKGHIITATPFTRLPGNPLSYELSFQAPRGLSGAPLWTWPPEPAAMVGIVIGNRSTEMNVFSSKERVADDKELVIERFEAMQTGIAIQSVALLEHHCRFTNSTLRSFFDEGRHE